MNKTPAPCSATEPVPCNAGPSTNSGSAAKPPRHGIVRSPSSDRRRRGLLAACTFLIFVLISAAPITARRHAFTTYTGDDGLSQLTVTALMQDDQGYLWVGTQAGLNRFDGERFQTFGTRNGLSGDWILDLAKDRDGAVWVAGPRGLSRIRHGMIDSYSTHDGLPSQHIGSLAVTADGSLWCGTTQGLARYRGAGFQTVPGTENRRIWSLLVDRTDRLWIGTSTGLLFLEGNMAEPLAALGSRPVHDLAEADSGHLWVASKGSIQAFDEPATSPSRGPVVELSEEDGIPNLDWGGVSLAAGRDGELWIGTETGLVRYREGKTLFFGAEQGLPLIHVLSILEDREGVLWLGGFGGLSRFLGRAFTTYTQDDGLPSSNVRPIVRDSRDRLWVGTAQGAGYLQGHRWHVLREEHGLPDDYVLSLAEDDGAMYIGTAGGLGSFRDGRLHVEASELQGRSVTSLALDGDVLWATGGGVGVFKRQSGTFQPVHIPDNVFTDPRLIVDRQRQVWVSGDRGISRWDGSSWTTFGERHGLAPARPYGLAEDGKGGVWLGYFASVGLSHFDGHGFRTYTTDDGLSNNSVYSLGLDPQDRLWVGTARGVDRFDGTYFRNYGTVEGYASTESNAGGFFADHDGTLWLGTAGGLSHFDPRSDLELEAPLLLSLRSLTLGGAPVQTADFPEGSSMAASVAAITMVNRKRVDLQYRLLDLHDTWQPINETEILVPNLGAGTYRLELRGRRYGEPWTTFQAPPFTIHPPFWRTPAFLALALGLSILAVVGWVRARTAWLRRQNLALELEVERRSKESEDARRAAEAANRAKSDFLAHMSHEIRTPLNAVIGLTSVLKNARLEPRERHHVETIEHSGRLLLALISNVLDFSRIEAGSVPLEARPFDLRSAVRASVELVQQQALDKGLKITARVDDSLPIAVVGDPTRFLQILWNLLGNAIKFTAEGEIQLRVMGGESELGPRLRIEVEDTGIGIPQDRQERIFDTFQQADVSTTRQYGGTGLGLAIVRRLLDLLGGEIRVRSRPGRGSTFTVELPLEEAEIQPEPEDIVDDAEPPKAGHSSRLRVLVVDDNPVNLLVIEAMLSELNHHAEQAEGGEQAVEAAQSRTYDLILMDIHMPVLDGIGATEQIRRLYSKDDLPIVAVTADVMEGTRERCLDAGMNDVLAKPVDLEDLEATIQQLGLARKQKPESAA